MSGTDYTQTPNLGLYKPTYNADGEQWGLLLNANGDVLDTVVGVATVVNVLAFGAKGDGATNDTAAIQNTLNTYAGKATVLVPDTGAPYMCGNLNMPTGTDLLLFGTLKSIPNAPIHLINLIASHVTIRGHGTLDANGAGQAPTNLIAAINGSCDYLLITGITLQNSNVWNLNITQSSHVWVDKVTMLNCVSANEFANGCDDCWLTGCYIDGVSEDEGFSFYGGVTNSGAIGNVVTNAGADGINVLCDASQPTPCANLTIADNICHDNRGSGIQINRGVGGTGGHTNIIVTGNRMYNDNVWNADGSTELFVDYATTVVISDNLVSGGGTNACSYGIGIGSNTTDVTITGNSVSTIGSATRPGIGIRLDSTNIVNVSGNTLSDFRSTQYMRGIGGIAGIANAFTGNLFGRLAGTISFGSIQPDTAIFNADGVGFSFGQALPVNAANDGAASTAGVPVGGIYRNGSVLQVRVT